MKSIYLVVRDISDEDDSGYLIASLFFSLEGAKALVEDIHRCKGECGWLEIKKQWFCFIGNNPRSARAVDHYIIYMEVNP